MIKLKPNEMLDLNIIGVWVVILIALLMLVYSINLIYLISLEFALLGYGLYLFLQIQKNKKSALFINKQEKWFVEINGEMYPVQLKDYWLLKQYIFLWVEGKQNSVSFVVTRSIIGPQRFSQLRAIIN